MSNLKCPFCQQELFYTYQQDGIVPNPNKGKVDGVFCDNCKMYGNETIWERLDRTRKALEIAVDALKDIRCVYTGDQTTKPSTMFGRASGALNKIQELEQKD